MQQNREGAEQALAEYIANKYQVPRDPGRHPSQILVLDVLNVYLADVVAKQNDPSIATGADHDAGGLVGRQDARRGQRRVLSNLRRAPHQAATQGISPRQDRQHRRAW